MSETTLRQLTLTAADPIADVQIFLGDGDGAEQSRQWISARVRLERPAIQSALLLQLAALKQSRDLIDAEIQRLEDHYRVASEPR